MPKAIGVFYFSGTGNTEAMAKSLTKELANLSANVDLHRIENNKLSPSIQNYNQVGLLFPGHAFNAPRIIFEFIKKLPKANNLPTFIIKTCGDNLWQGGPNLFVRKALKSKGYQVLFEDFIVMPSNFAMKYPDNFSKQLYLNGLVKTKDFAQNIINNKTKIQKLSFWVSLLSWLISFSENLGIHFIKVRASKKCNLCEICVKECPNHNLFIKNNKVNSKHTCLCCMHCFYACPKKAISSTFSKLFVFKDGYNLQEIINNPNLSGNYVTKETKGYYQRFYNYLNNS